MDDARRTEHRRLSRPVLRFLLVFSSAKLVFIIALRVHAPSVPS
jgi:hypothetical protein